MTNPFIYYTALEIIYGVATIFSLIAFLLLYNSYYLKKRSGIYHILTLATPVTISLFVYIFAGWIGIDPSGYNTIPILWIPILYSVAHTIYFLNLLHIQKESIDRVIKFDFITDIKREGYIFCGFATLVAISTIAFFTLDQIIPVAIGLVTIIITTVVNSTIFIRKI